ncbi:MAG: hypothetical protein ACSHYB_09405 [Roseibacillus sp.]
MTRFRSLGQELLEKEDGEVSAAILPFDQVNVATAFETATFGMG